MTYINSFFSLSFDDCNLFTNQVQEALFYSGFIATSFESAYPNQKAIDLAATDNPPWGIITQELIK